MGEPQSWMLIGLFATLMIGGMSLMTTLINRTTNTAINGLRHEMNARFDAVDARFESVDTRFDAMATQIQHLDRDISWLMRRWAGESTD